MVLAYLDNTGLTYLWSQLKTKFAAISHTHAEATTTTAGLMSAADKVTLNNLSGGSNLVYCYDVTLAASLFDSVTTYTDSTYASLGLDDDWLAEAVWVSGQDNLTSSFSIETNSDGTITYSTATTPSGALIFVLKLTKPNT